jgi:plasmid stabilization system protein ParE
VGRVRFTQLAEADLLEIGLYTHRTWGQDSATAISESSKDAVASWLTIPRVVDPVMTSGQVYDAQGSANMLFSIVEKATAIVP